MSQLLQELLCRITGEQLLCRLQLLQAIKATEAGQCYRVGLLCAVGCSALERTAHANGGRLNVPGRARTCLVVQCLCES